jgi:hypothetical protein
MQKHNFGTTCPDALFVEKAPVLPENEKKCVDISRPGCTVMHYVTRRCHQIQKQKFGVTCVESITETPELEK